MAVLFCNAPIISFVIIFLGLLVIDKIDGYPYQWPEFFSSGNVKISLLGKESEKERDLVTSISKNYGRNSALSEHTVHYSESSSTYNDENRKSRVVGRLQNEQTSELDDDDANNDENDSIEDVKSDDEYDNDTDVGGNDTNDEITRLIKQAVQDDLFLSPESWANVLANRPFDIQDDEKMPAKIQIPRSLGNPPNTVPQTETDKIFFPDDFIRNPVPSCKNTTFCLNPTYYLSDNDVESVLKLRFLEPVSEPLSISERIGPIEDDNGLCVSREQVIQPKTGLDDKNIWRYILNNEKYVQTVRVEICEARDGACRIIDNIAPGYKTSCKQNYIYRQLVGLGPNGTKMIPFQIPSSCCCHVKFTGDSTLRIGVNLGKRKQQSSVSNENKN